MELVKRRVELARQRGFEPLRWVAAAELADRLPQGALELAGVPVEVGGTRWKLERWSHNEAPDAWVGVQREERDGDYELRHPGQ